MNNHLDYVTEDPIGGDSTFEDMLIQMKLREAPLKDESSDESDFESEQVKHARALSNITSQEMEEIEDSRTTDDDTLEKLRRKRLAELRREREMSKFGKVFDVTEREFDDQISLASDTATVVLLIYREGCLESNVMVEIVESLATKFPTVKFARMLARPGIIKGFPMSDCPTVMVYQKRCVMGQFVRLSGFYGESTTPLIVEWDLAQLGVISTFLEEDPRKHLSRFKIQRAPPKSSEPKDTGIRSSKIRNALLSRRGKNDDEFDFDENDDDDDSDDSDF